MLMEEKDYQYNIDLLIKEYLKKWNILKNIKESLTVVESQFQIFKRQQEDLLKELESLNSESDYLTKMLDAGKNILSELTDPEDRITVINDYIVETTNKKKQWDAKINDLMKEHKKIALKINDKNEQISSYRRNLQTIREELVDLKERIEEWPFFKDSLKQLKESIANLEGEKNRILNLKSALSEKEKLKLELQSLEDNIILRQQKIKIELEIARLEELRQQLRTKITHNMQAISTIESHNDTLVTEIGEIDSNIEALDNNIVEKINLLSSFEKEIELNEINTELKEKDLNVIIQNIVIFQNWKDSIWRRVIAVLTFGMFCSYKSVKKKLDQEYAKKDIIAEELRKLRQVKLEKDKLADEIRELAKNADKFNEERIKTQLIINNNEEKAENLKKTISEQNFSLSSTLVEIDTQKKKLKDISVENVKPLELLEGLRENKIAKLSLLDALNLDELNEKLETLNITQSTLHKKVDEITPCDVDIALDNFKQEIEIQKQKFERESFPNLEYFVERSNSTDSGIDMTEPTQIMRLC